MAVWQTQDSDRVMTRRPTLFLDRDGVVVRDKNYLADPEAVELLPGVAEAMVTAREAGWQLIGVSNQSGLGRGYFQVSDFAAVMNKLDSDLEAAGARFDGFFYCPHSPADGCDCRKPLTGLLTEAAVDYSWDAQTSWVIGDKGSDVELGQNGGLGSILVRTGYGMAQESAVCECWNAAERFLVADDLADAVKRLLKRPEMRAGGGRF